MSDSTEDSIRAALSMARKRIKTLNGSVRWHLDQIPETTRTILALKQRAELSDEIRGLAAMLSSDVLRAYREDDAAAMRLFGNNMVAHAANKLRLLLADSEGGKK